jgi:hypothetical protein
MSRMFRAHFFVFDAVGSKFLMIIQVGKIGMQLERLHNNDLILW